MAYHICLFDLDGTLTDSKLGITRSAQYALAKFGIEVDAEQLNHFIGPPLEDSFREFYHFDPEQAKQAVVYYRERFARIGMYENEVYPGIPELLARLQQAGKRLFVATSKLESFSKQIIEHFELAPYFEAVVGSTLDGTRSSKEKVIQAVIAEYGLEAEREHVVMIGDRKHDLIGASANRIASIGITYGYGTLDELLAHQPTLIVGSVAELGKLLGC